MKNDAPVRAGFENWPRPQSELADFVEHLRPPRRPARGVRALLASLLGAGPERP